MYNLFNVFELNAVLCMHIAKEFVWWTLVRGIVILFLIAKDNGIFHPLSTRPPENLQEQHPQYLIGWHHCTPAHICTMYSSNYIHNFKGK